jgi:quercetin dioxygenase-like cupin family protein
MTPERAQSMQYVYDFSRLDRLPESRTSAIVAARRLLSGPSLSTGKSSTIGAVLTGAHIILTLGMQARGSGAKAHTHPNEQFNYIVQGTMTGEIEGEVVFAPAGTVLHTPARAVHTGLACPDEDLIFLAMKDTRHGIVGPPVDGKYEGPNYLPGFGTRARERQRSTAELIAESGRDPAGEKTRYVYDFTTGHDKAGRTSSATGTADLTIAGCSAAASLLTGEMLHVARLRYAAHSTDELHVHPNEQFTFVIEGAIDAHIAGEDLGVSRHCIAHIPANTPHRLSTGDGGALVVTVQDTRYRFAG